MCATNRRSRRVLAVAVSLALAASQLPAATITISSPDDDATSAFCNLRNALASIESASATAPCAAAVQGAFGSNDTILFANALTNATITLQQGEFALTKPLTIQGSGQTIDAAQTSRVLDVNATQLTASDLTLTHGSVSGTNAAGAGGAIRATNSTLVLARVSVTNNSSTGDGAAIYSVGGNLSLSASTISNNTAGKRGGGLALVGGTLDLTRSTVSGNTATNGGGLFLHYAQLADGTRATLAATTLSGNSVMCGGNFCGGAMYASIAQLSVSGSTLSGNQVSGGSYLAGGAYVFNTAATFVNSTVANNVATGNDYVAGALWEVDGVGTTADGLTLINCTVTGNSATSNIQSTSIGGGVLSGVESSAEGALYSGRLLLSNAIVSGNAPAGTDLLTTHLSPSTTLDAAYSLLGTALNASPFNAPAKQNRFSDAAGLGPLQNNGGPTLTLAPLAGSPAIDAGSNALAQFGGTPLHFDQRGAGHPRAIDGIVDIGAVEYGADVVFADGFENGP